uniref:Uncharacterized protein n=1 Tax=Haemonchus contortus TaxID=6289 RepID=A0A7I5E8S6_HAECO
MKGSQLVKETSHRSPWQDIENAQEYAPRRRLPPRFPKVTTFTGISQPIAYNRRAITRQDRFRRTTVISRKLQVGNIASRPLPLQIGKSISRSRNTCCSRENRPIHGLIAANGIKTSAIIHGAGCISRPCGMHLSKAVASSAQPPRAPLLLSRLGTPKEGCPRRNPPAHQDTPTHGPR